MSAETHYQILGVPENATQEDIKKAYSRQARFYHPDRHQHRDDDRRYAEERMKLINLAYETLRDPDKRRQYDSELGREREQRERSRANASDTAGGSQTSSGGARARAGDDAPKQEPPKPQEPPRPEPPGKDTRSASEKAREKREEGFFTEPDGKKPVFTRARVWGPTAVVAMGLMLWTATRGRDDQGRPADGATPSPSPSASSYAAPSPLPSPVSSSEPVYVARFDAPPGWTRSQGTAGDGARTTIFTSPDGEVTITLGRKEGVGDDFVAKEESRIRSLENDGYQITAATDTRIAGEKCRRLTYSHAGRRYIHRVFTHAGAGYYLLFDLPAEGEAFSRWEPALDAARMSLRFADQVAADPVAQAEEPPQEAALPSEAATSTPEPTRDSARVQATPSPAAPQPAATTRPEERAEEVVKVPCRSRQCRYLNDSDAAYCVKCGTSLYN